MPRRVALGLVAAAVLGLVVRWGWVLAVDPEVPEVGDAAAYHLLAEGIAEGEGYVRPFDRVLFDEHRATAEYPPLHPAVLAAADAVGIDGVQGQRLWLSLFGAASAAVTGLLAWRLSGRADATLVAAGVAAVHPLWFQADATLMPESLAALLGAAAVALAIGARSTTALVGAGALCALAALTRSEAILLVPIVAFAGGRRSWRTAAVPVVAAVVVLAPWFARDTARFDELVPLTTNIGSVVDGANCDATYGGPLLGYWQFVDGGAQCFEGFTQPELAADDESVAAAAHRRAGWEYARDHVSDWPKVALARLGRTVALFRPGQLADLGALEGRAQAADWTGYALVWASLPLAAVGAWALRRDGRQWWVPAAVVLAIWGSTALTYGNPRFLAVAQPSLVALAAVGLTSRHAVENGMSGIAHDELEVTGVESVAIPIVSNPRFPLLDGVRAIAAVLVLVTHVSFLTRANIDHPLGPEMARMNTGVSVFFVLSGFLLYRPFVAARLAGDGRPDTAPYLWRRLLRIYPAYWIVLGIVVALGPATIPDTKSLVLWGSLAHVLSPAHFFGPMLQSYTLGVEVCFYLFLPLWAALVRRLPGPVVRTELRALLVLGLVGLGWQLYCLGETGAMESVWRNNLPGWFDHFAVGMAIAVVHAAAGRAHDRLAAVPAGVWWGIALAAMLAMSRGLGIERTAFYIEWWQDLGVHVFGLVMAVGILLPAAVGPVGVGMPRRVLANRVVAWLGVVSYGIYLWHEFLLDRWVAWRWTPPFEADPAPFELTLLVVLGGSVALASASWLFVERPLLRLKRLVRSTAQVLDGPLAPRLVALTLLALAVRVLFVLGWRRFDGVAGDPFWYHEGANLLADGHGFVNVFRFGDGIVQPGADHPPAYLVWLSLSSLVGGTSLLAHQLWSCVLGALAVPFLGLAGARMGGTRTAMAAASIAAASPLLWVYDGLLLSETLAITSAAAAIWLSLRARDEGGTNAVTFAALGAALGVLTLTRAEAALVVPFVLLALSCRHRRRALVAGVAACGVLVAPWVVANLVRFDRPSTLSTQLGTTLAHAYCEDTFEGEFIGWWSFPCAADLPVPPGDSSNADHAYREAALDYAGDNLGRLPVVLVARFGRAFGTWDPVDQATLDRVEGRPEGVANAAAVLWYPTALASVIGWVALRRRGWSWFDLVGVWTPVACVVLTVLVFYGTTRFRALAEPSFAVLAGAAVTRKRLVRR